MERSTSRARLIPELTKALAKATLWPALLVAGLIGGFSAASAPQPAPARRAEYVTIRWDGRNNTHLIRPGGKVEHIGDELRRFERPARIDERSFYLNIAVNGLAKEGYEVTAMSEDEILMRSGSAASQRNTQGSRSRRIRAPSP